MAQITFGPSFLAKLEAAQEQLEERAQEKAVEIVTYPISISPVDTGAYVDSFAATQRGFGSGTRSRSSRGKPRGQPTQPNRDAAISRVVSSIMAMELVESEGFVLSNRAPHARFVENGNQYGSRPYKVFAKTRSKFS